MTVGSGLPRTLAREDPPAPSSAAEAKQSLPAPPHVRDGADVLSETLTRMAADLKAREEGLKAREERAADLERRLDLLAKQAGVPIAPREGTAGGEAGTAAPPEVAGTTPSDLLSRLLRSYESMEPEGAAAALRKLFGMDREAVVDLVAGMSPRKAGAVLDALAAVDPVMTAELSHELWKRGRAVPAAEAP